MAASLVTLFEPGRDVRERMEHLVAVATVRDAAAICDYLETRLGPDDAVTAVTVHDPDAATPDSDRREALNVVRVRLAGTAVETVERDGEVGSELASVLAERDPDKVLAGRGSDASDGWEPGAAVRAIAGEADAPVVLVPLPAA